MPPQILKWLLIVSITFCLYSTACYFLLKNNWTPFIKIIGMANLLYCLLTFTVVILTFPVLTGIGVGYFLIEILIIFMLAFVQIKTARFRRKQPN